MRRLALLLPLALLLAACSADTKPATDVTHDSAKLNANVAWDDGDGPGEYWFEYKPTVGSTWTQAPHTSFPDMHPGGSSTAFERTVTGLTPSTAYVFRFCGYGDKDTPALVCFDADGAGVDPTNPPPNPHYDTFTTLATGFTPGMVFNADLGAADAGVSLGAKVMRVEFAIGATASSLDSTVDYYADRGIRILMLAGFDGFSAPSVAQANNVGTWAARFGPGGSFWAGRPDGQLAVRHIEFGNELNYNYQAGGTNAAEAQAYGHRVVTAKNAILSTGKPVGLLAMGMPADSGAPEWLNNMFIAEPGLASKVDGWTIHPYGPSYLSKLSSHISQLSAHGVPSSVPIDITEWGISSDNGRALSDNYGWPVNMTYAQAGAALSTFVGEIRGHATIGPRLRHVLIYQTRDQSATGASSGREAYFGGLQNNMAEKGAYTAAVRNLLDE